MDLRKNLIVCIGSPIIDITARVTCDFLQKYNLKPNSAISCDEKTTKIFEDLQKFNPICSLGGSVTNTVKTLQNLLTYPSVCCYIGAIGADEFGKELCRKLRAEDINVLFEEVDWSPTGRCAVLLLDDNRSFVTDLAASKYLSYDFIESDAVRNVVIQGEYFYISAFLFHVSIPIVQKICTYATTEDKTLIFNIGATFLSSQYANEFKATLPNVNILIGNIEEATQLALILECPSEDPDIVASFLHSRCHKSQINHAFVIITRGDQSIVLASNNGISSIEVPALKHLKKLNTSGAGDYFIAGFLAGYILKNPIENCITSGIGLSQKMILQNS